jgi:hypothetical protein
MFIMHETWPLSSRIEAADFLFKSALLFFAYAAGPVLPCLLSR